MHGMFDFAVRKHYLDTSPMNNVTISVKFRQVVKKTGKTETYNTEELAQLNNYLDGMYAETGDSVFLAVKLNFMLGLRVGERITSRQVAYVLEKYAERNSLKVKSTHKMRKTYASRLNACDIPLDYIRESLGHSNLNTTLGYIYNPLTTEETQNLLEKAL